MRIRFLEGAICFILIGSFGAYCPPANAQTSDKSFATDAASGGMAEVKLGQLAQNKGSDPSVKDFGKRMEMDHSRANEQLKDVASRNKISLPGELNKTDQATVARLSKLSGPAFDKAYSAAMVADHQKDVAAFKKEAASGQNMDIKQFATQTLPTLQEHFKMAQDMERIASSGAVPPATPATR